jgi:hypothetical protein
LLLASLLLLLPYMGARAHFYRYFRQPFVQDFPFLASVLRLSCKYFICVPRRQCLERLQSYFPTTLAEWDRRERMALAPDGHYDPRHEIPSPIHVINLARELGVGSVLPAAFYDLARYGTSKTPAAPSPSRTSSSRAARRRLGEQPRVVIVVASSSSITTTTTTTTIEGGAGGRGEPSSPFGTSSDGTDHRGYPSSSPPPPPPRHHYHHPPPPPPLSSSPMTMMLAQDSAPVRLSHDDLVQTFRGREALQRSVATFLDAQVKSRAPAAGCAGGQACRDAFYFIALNTLRAVGGIAAGRDGDPLFTLAQMVDMLHHTEWVDGQYLRGLPMCGKCREEFVPAVHAGRQAIWDQIPAWFGLEPYDVLRARDEELNERDVYP